MKRWMKNVLIMLFALAFLMPAMAMAGNTAPYSLSRENVEMSRREDLGKVSRFTENRGVYRIAASNEWLYQVRLDSISLKLSLYTPEGRGVLLQENLVKTGEGNNVRLILRQINRRGGMLLQMDQKAVDTLERLGITEIVVADYDLYIQNVYQVAELKEIRSMMNLRETEELCVRGEGDPVTVVDENGVRRLQNP